jgi:outer membrane receptor protein involved in Fe transport
VSAWLSVDADYAFETGDLAGQGGPTIDVGGKIKVKDIFAEVRVPIMEGQAMADYLNLTGSVRRSDYNTGFTTDTWGLGLEYAPVKDYRFRGSASRAVRAPNVVELYSSQGLGLYDNDEDPCAGATPTRTLAQCQRTGVTAAQYGTIPDNPAGQYNALFGGNARLKPETADTQTLGIVATPFKNFSATLDYYKVKVKDTVGTFGATLTLQQCLDTGNPTFCSLITRDRLGSLWALPEARIVDTNQNIGGIQTEGFDVGFTYSMKVGNLGSLTANMNGTYITKQEIEPIKGLGKYDCVGLYGPSCGTPTPEWRHKLRFSWATPWNLDLALTWRYFDAVLLDRTSSNVLITGNVNPVDRELPRQNYLDLAATYNFNKNLTFRAGVNNITDRDPPLSAQVGAGAGNGNTYPQVYDALGRRIFVNVTAKF